MARIIYFTAPGGPEVLTYKDIDVPAPAPAVVPHPPSLSFAQASSIWMMFITVYGAFIEAAKLQAGDVVLIPAASSSVGLAAIQLANLVGATPIALTRGGAKRRQLLDAGAAFVIATEEQDMVAEVLRITDGAGARVVFDPVGGPSFGKLVKAMTTGGILLVYGALSEEPAQLSCLDLPIKLPPIVGYTICNTSGDPVRQKAASTSSSRASLRAP